MLDYKRILVPYDGSEYAKRALDRAVSVAGCCDGAKLSLRPFPGRCRRWKKNRAGKSICL